jgi:hypothetical protein
MKKKITATVIGVVIASSVQAVVPRANAERMDKNKDGKVSLGEYVSAVSNGFERKDKNNDGVLDKTEFANANLIRLGDKNKDGKLTKDEYEHAYKMQFKRAHDKNGDGFISGDEIK